ncbi:sensor histidine kinase [Actinomadura craniellae]|uniref:histidine kinase n=1 Tax=Actinomadura craniellae TaxID=2231787 RepID=A0A365H6N1_9ACTN|nr:histidine kinase [Actinomadura craniellae]RAY13923.1 sensor histidine kinase [Actinomadura craniellae]
MRFTTRQDALLAGAALAGALTLLASRGYAIWDSEWDPGRGWRALPLLGLSAALLFRRTAPLLGLAIAVPAGLADLFMGPNYASLVIFPDALYATALYGPRRAAEVLLGVTVSVSALLLGGAALLAGDLAAGVITAALAGILWVTPVLTAMVVREHRNRAEAERQRAEQVARLAELDRLAAITAERARMARELHDVVANHLSAVALHSSAVLKLPDLAAADVRRSLAVIRENSVQGLTEMRRMIGLLREGGTDDPATPRLADLGRLVEQAVRPDLPVTLAPRGDPLELPIAVELAAYRIVQESLTNMLKHAGPGRAEVALEYRPDGVAIEVHSPLAADGAGGSGLPGSGSGLIGMRERATLLGGDFTAGPDGRIWRVTAWLPLDGAAGGDGGKGQDL